jgi:hypothetical protein
MFCCKENLSSLIGDKVIGGTACGVRASESDASLGAAVVKSVRDEKIGHNPIPPAYFDSSGAPPMARNSSPTMISAIEVCIHLDLQSLQVAGVQDA